MGQVFSRHAARQSRTILQQRLKAGLAQLVEHLICNQGVAGSNPAAGTNKINGLERNLITVVLLLVST